MNKRQVKKFIKKFRKISDPELSEYFDFYDVINKKTKYKKIHIRYSIYLNKKSL